MGIVLLPGGEAHWHQVCLALSYAGVVGRREGQSVGVVFQPAAPAPAVRFGWACSRVVPLEQGIAYRGGMEEALEDAVHEAQALGRTHKQLRAEK